MEKRMEKNYLNGKWIHGKGDPISSVDPNTGLEKNIINSVSEDQLKNVIEDAHIAFQKWSKFELKDRINLVSKIKDQIIEAYGNEGEKTHLKSVITQDVGKRLPEADIEVIETSDMIESFTKQVKEIFIDHEIKLDENLWSDKKSIVVYEPKGVVGIIKAWNYPLEVPIWSIIPAILAGNTVVFKPSENAMNVGIEIAKLFDHAGFPKGVFNLVLGDSVIGEKIVENPKISMISFTGSVSVGRKISINCANQIKDCSLELSGNDAAIVDKNVNIELAVNGLVWGAFCNSGQVCVGVKRALIHSDIYEEVRNKLIEKTNALKHSIDYGPLISNKQVQSVEKLISDAVLNRGKVITGGDRVSGNEGFYFKPTVIENLNDKMKLFNEECFGPVLPICKFDNYDEAIQIANNSNYGLGASVWTSNKKLARDLANQLNVGMVWINDVNVAFATAPWTGRKNSGGGIDLSKHGILEYVNLKHINSEFTSFSKREWWYPY